MLIKKKQFKKLVSFCLEAIFPKTCLNCGWEGAWLCDNCRMIFSYKTVQLCPGCRQESRWGRVCADCRQGSLAAVLSAFDYNQKLAAEMIKACKYRFAATVGQDMGRLLSEFVKNYLTITERQAGGCPRWVDNFKNLLIIPVPLSKKRRNWRGFNQASILANVLAESFNMEVNETGLKRLRYDKPQAKLKAEQRQGNVSGVFSWQGQDLGGRGVLLIDDVVTTGATLNSAAKELKNAGSGVVVGLTFAG